MFYLFVSVVGNVSPSYAAPRGTPSNLFDGLAALHQFGMFAMLNSELIQQGFRLILEPVLDVEIELAQVFAHLSILGPTFRLIGWLGPVKPGLDIRQDVVGNEQVVDESLFPDALVSKSEVVIVVVKVEVAVVTGRCRQGDRRSG